MHFQDFHALPLLSDCVDYEILRAGRDSQSTPSTIFFFLEGYIWRLRSLETNQLGSPYLSMLLTDLGQFFVGF